MALKAGRRGPRLEAGWLRGDYGLTAADPARPSGGRPRGALRLSSVSACVSSDVMITSGAWCSHDHSAVNARARVRVSSDVTTASGALRPPSRSSIAWSQQWA